MQNKERLYLASYDESFLIFLFISIKRNIIAIKAYIVCNYELPTPIAIIEEVITYYPVQANLMAGCSYISLNTFSHLIMKEMNFVIRMKDISNNDIHYTYVLPDRKFDTHIRNPLPNAAIRKKHLGI